MTLIRYTTVNEAGQVKLGQSLDPPGRRGDMRDDSAEIPLQSGLWEATESSSGMVRVVPSWMISIQHSFCRQRRPTSLQRALKSSLYLTY